MQALPPPVPTAQVIVVTGNPLPGTPAERAQHVDTLDERDLADAPAHGLDAILVDIPGVQLFRRSDSTSGHPTSQGVTLRALGGNASSRALLVLDGVPQTDPFGGWINWPAYDPAGLDQAKVVRGGGSVTYGPGAIAGVIDLRSRTRAGVDASIEGGSRQSLRGHAFWGERLGESLLTLNVQGGRSDGFVPLSEATRGPIDRAAPYREASLRARWVAPLGDAVEVQLGGLAFADARERGVPFTDNRTRGADLSARVVGRGAWQWSALAYAQWRNFRSSFASVNDERTSAARVALQDSVPSRGIGGGLELRPPLGRGVDLRIGGDARFVSGESRELFAFSGGEPTRRRISGGDSVTAGLFAEGSVILGALTLSGGARLDHWRIADGRLVERPLGGVPTRNDAYADRSGWQPTARASALLEFARGLDLRAAAYSGWRLPTLNELFRPFRAGADATAANPSLEPETLTGAEVGVRLRRGPFEMQLTAFSNRLANAIANVTLGHGPGIFPGVGFVAGAYSQRNNLDAVRVRGLEASAQAKRGPWSLNLGASWTRARVEADGLAAALDGRRPAQTPNLVLTGALGWEDGDRAASLRVRHVGAQYEDDLNRRRLAPATTVDAFFAWPISRRIQFIARGENLFDEQVVAGIGDDGTVERASPRTLWFGLRLRAK
ncbi:MAG TPA: TonB-dependent receptor [Sphingomicrobium sp.]|nr:TonB-dependent receptor [Sphingomicrobium sp.]